MAQGLQNYMYTKERECCMALLPIIYISVILFAGVAAVLLVTSYVSYRVKQKAPKPWELHEEERDFSEAAAFEPQIITAEREIPFYNNPPQIGYTKTAFLPGGEKDPDEPEPKRRAAKKHEPYTVYKTTGKNEKDFMREYENSDPPSESRIRAYDGPRIRRVGHSNFLVSSNMVLGDSFTDLLVFYDDGR